MINLDGYITTSIISNSRCENVLPIFFNLGSLLLDGQSTKSTGNVPNY